MSPYEFTQLILHCPTEKGFLDRRSGRDRRKLYDVHYLSYEAFLENLRVERRFQPERRADWKRVSKWGSVPAED